MQNEDGSEKIDGNTGIGSSDNRDGHQEPGKDDHGHTVTNRRSRLGQELTEATGRLGTFNELEGVAQKDDDDDDDDDDFFRISAK